MSRGAVLASAKLIDRIGTLPRGITTTDLGPVVLRGRSDAVPLVSLSREVTP
jgi:class 3 adenylate cyclase